MNDRLSLSSLFSCISLFLLSSLNVSRNVCVSSNIQVFSNSLHSITIEPFVTQHQQHFAKSQPRSIRREEKQFLKLRGCRTEPAFSYLASQFGKKTAEELIYYLITSFVCCYLCSMIYPTYILNLSIVLKPVSSSF